MVKTLRQRKTRADRYVNNVINSWLKQLPSTSGAKSIKDTIWLLGTRKVWDVLADLKPKTKIEETNIPVTQPTKSVKADRDWMELYGRPDVFTQTPTPPRP